VDRAVLAGWLTTPGGSFEHEHDGVVPEVRCGDGLVEAGGGTRPVMPPTGRPAADHVGGVDDEDLHPGSVVRSRHRACRPRLVTRDVRKRP
jgi:hypothetical protein